MGAVRVAITGAGVSTPFGNSLESYWRSLISGKDFSEEYHEKQFVKVCITTALAALQDARLRTSNRVNCMILGTGMGISSERTIPFQLKRILRKGLEEKTGGQWNIIIIANACCAAAQAIAYAYDLVHAGKYDFVVAGGVELASEIMQNGFKRLNCIDEECCRPFDKHRKGIRVGEGAAFFVIQRNGKNSIGELLGQAVTNDAYHIVSPEPEGKYIERAIKLVLERSNRKPADIDAVVAHGTGTKQNDAIEARVLGKLFENIYVTAPKSRIGHTGGASGAFGLLTALGMLRYQKIPPIHHLQQLDENMKLRVVQKEPEESAINNVLIVCFAFGGTNTVLLCGH